MNTLVQASLDAIDTALTTLLDSISTYNPSPAAAATLVAADDALTHQLDILSHHQAAHSRILTLRDTAALLDDRLTDTLTLLAEVRSRLPPPTPACARAGSNNARAVNYDELLAYASKIAKFSQPPSIAAFQKLVAIGDGTVDEKVAEGEKPPFGLTEQDLAMLDPSSAIVFKPWPSEEQMKIGSLRAVGDGTMVEDMLSLAEQKRMKEEREEYERVLANGGARDDEKEAEMKKEGELSGRRTVLPVQREKAAISLSLDLYDPEDE